MNIWIFNHYALTPDMGGGTRHYDFARELIKRGHVVTIVSSSFHYSKYKEMREYGDKEHLKENINGVNFIWIKTPSYFGNNILRVKNMFSYTFKILTIIPTLNLERPDIIIGSSVHLFTVYGAYKLSKKYNRPFIMEVRDIWPQTLVDMGMSKWNPFVLLLGMLEKFLYKKADKIISSLPYAYNHINNFVSKEKFIWISNGVDLNNIKYTKKQKTDKFVICYMGAIGVSNNLDLLVDVAKRLKNKEDIYFRIIGSGVEKEKLKNRVNVEKLNNISIESAVSKDKVSGILQLSDVLFLSLIDSPLYRFGISLNKLFDYMAAGRVVLFAGTSKNNPIKDAQVGYIIGSDDIDALERAILEIYFLKQSERDVIGERLRSHVEHKYSIPTLVDKLEVLLKCEISRFEK